MMTRSQKHAQAIAGQVGEVQHMSRKIQKQYGSLCHRFPIMVLRTGLAQAVGFLAAKSKYGPWPVIKPSCRPSKLKC
ncbi:MAG: type III-B CRISPR module-associated protein Cmr5 [Candidatus Methylumidiphilus sp.]